MYIFLLSVASSLCPESRRAANPSFIRTLDANTARSSSSDVEEVNSRASLLRGARKGRKGWEGRKGRTRLQAAEAAFLAAFLCVAPRANCRVGVLLLALSLSRSLSRRLLVDSVGALRHFCVRRRTDSFSRSDSLFPSCSFLNTDASSLSERGASGRIPTSRGSRLVAPAGGPSGAAVLVARLHSCLDSLWVMQPGRETGDGRRERRELRRLRRRYCTLVSPNLTSPTAWLTRRG